MTIYTRTGDEGNTSLGKKGLVPKSHAIIHSLGELDELNSNLGMLIDLMIYQRSFSDQVIYLQYVQNILFELGDVVILTQKEEKEMTKHLQQEVDDMEKRIDKMEQHMPPLTGFILPGGGRVSSQAHIARTVCRRAERWLPDGIPTVHQFINRLSDYLYVLARLASMGVEVRYVGWRRQKV